MVGRNDYYPPHTKFLTKYWGGYPWMLRAPIFGAMNNMKKNMNIRNFWVSVGIGRYTFKYHFGNVVVTLEECRYVDALVVHETVINK